MQSPSATDAAALPELSGHDVHVSDVCSVLALNLPASQSVHAAADNADALNLPAAQAATLEPEPVKPASALQSPLATDAAKLSELSGHGVQDVALSTALSVSAQDRTALHNQTQLSRQCLWLSCQLSNFTMVVLAINWWS
jgi:hypothetical protein